MYRSVEHFDGTGLTLYCDKFDDLGILGAELSKTRLSKGSYFRLKIDFEDITKEAFEAMVRPRKRKC